jgi:uncharacterized protein (UPF0303 family)
VSDRDQAAELLPLLEEQERRLVPSSFSHEDAWRLGNLLVRMASERGAPVAIDIRVGEQQVFHCALAGSSADNDGWIDRKRRVVLRYGCSSYQVGRRFAARGEVFEDAARLPAETYAAHGGSFPLRVGMPGSPVVGTVSVSGLPQAEDHALIVEALEGFLGQPPSGSPPQGNG